MKSGTKIFWGLLLAALVIGGAFLLLGFALISKMGGAAVTGGANGNPVASVPPQSAAPPASSGGAAPAPAPTSSDTAATPASLATLTVGDAAKSPLCQLPAGEALRYVALGPSIGENKQLVIRICENQTFTAEKKTLLTSGGTLFVAEGETEQGVIWADVSKDLRPGGFTVDRYKRLGDFFPGKTLLKGIYDGNAVNLDNPIVFALPRSSSKTGFCEEIRNKPKPSEDDKWAREIWARCMAGGGHNAAVAQTMAWASREDMAAANASIHTLRTKVAELDQKVVTTPIAPKVVDYNAGGPSK